MSFTPLEETRIAIIGLGYVGLPLAVRLSAHFPVIGFDVDSSRINELQTGYDRTGECDSNDLEKASFSLSIDPSSLVGTDVYIVTVPTPVGPDNEPDLSAVLSACQIVGKALRNNAVVVFESTVYPGVTDDICGPALAEASGLICGQDFFLGYSPERINPGDKVHTVDKITKVVSGQTSQVADYLMALYGKLTNGNVFQAKDIKTAEAAKVIENAQRDINIAFVNEVAMIFNQMGIQTHDVLAAAGTKWNFLNFTPGLVGGHCIGVDPYYLAHAARQLGHDPEVVLAGRRINDDMAGFLARQIDRQMQQQNRSSGPARILALGLTFKENVPDLRNSKAADLIKSLQKLGHHVDVHDPLADSQEAEKFYGIGVLETLADAKGYDCIISVVAHASYGAFTAEDFVRVLKPGGLVADLKGIWRNITLAETYGRWEL